MRNFYTTFDPANKSGKLFALLLLAIAVACLALVGWTGLKAAQLAREGETAEGRVVSVESMRQRDSNGKETMVHCSTIRFRDGKGAQHEIVHRSKLREDERVEVLYLASDPENARLNRASSLWAAPILIGVFSSLFFVGGGWMFVACQRAAELRDWLARHGEKIAGEICGVLENRNYERQGYSHTSYQLIARALQSKQFAEMKFHSRGIDGEPRSDLVGKPVEILIDPDDPERYFVNIDQLV